MIRTPTSIRRPALVVAALLSAGLFTACGSSSYDRESFKNDLIADGQGLVTEAHAECIVAGLEERIGADRLDDFGSPTEEEATITAEVTVDCLLAS